MPWLGAGAAGILALVLVVAAVTKSRHPGRTAEELEAIGLRWPRALAWVLGPVELATAAVLVVSPAWGGVLAFALLSGFTVVLVGLVRSGRPVPCHCFGSLSREPVSGLTLVRNAGLLILAAVAAASPG